MAFLCSLFHCCLWLIGLTFSINLFFLVDNFAIILYLHSVLFGFFYWWWWWWCFFQLTLNDVYICLLLFVIALHIVLMNYSSLLSKSFLGLVYIGKHIWESFSKLLLCHQRWNPGNINRKSSLSAGAQISLDSLTFLKVIFHDKDINKRVKQTAYLVPGYYESHCWLKKKKKINFIGSGSHTDLPAFKSTSCAEVTFSC